MNRHYRIGVFDSGVGGLELFERLRHLMPDEEFYYFADTVNNPYGQKDRSQIERFLSEIVDGMLLRRVKLLVIACNTASAVFVSLGRDHPLRCRLRKAGVDVIPITSSEAISELGAVSPSRVTVVGTRLTIECGIYQALITEFLPACVVKSLAAPDWVDRVERPLPDGQAEHQLRLQAVKEILEDSADKPPESLLLACTHFPRMLDEIRMVVGEQCLIVNPARALAHFVKNHLLARGLEAPARREQPEAMLFTNGSAVEIEKQIAGMKLAERVQVRQVDIRSDLSGKLIDVVGYGVTGRSLIRYLAGKQSCRLRVRDRNPAVPEKLAEDFPNLNAEAIVGDDYLLGVEKADVVFRSPGIAADLPAFSLARSLGVPVMSDVELFLKHAPGRRVAITGTNGKTTTTLLVHRLFQSQLGEDVHLIGNVGRPVLDDLGKLNERSLCAMELSSFQLEELSSLPVEASILLNITPDHLDRHGNMDAYIAAKGRIFTLLESSSYAIYNIDSETIVNRLLPKGCSAKMVPFSLIRPLDEGAFLIDNDLVIRHRDRGEMRIDDFLGRRRFSGEHNLENLMSAAAAGFLLGVDIDAIEKLLLGFAGVSYRIEHFYRLGGVDCYDDSKGTNPDATLKALAAINQPIRLVAGGVGKGYTFDEIALACKGRVCKVYLFGAISESFAESLSSPDVELPFEISTDLEAATLLAWEQANDGDALLFSPACASPAGEKYYQRGDRFKAAVSSLGENELLLNGDILRDPLADR